MKKLLTCLGLVMALATTTGCEIYFGEPDDDWGDDDSWGDDDGGWSCYSDYDCAGGCYCDENNGTCVETGFCTTDADCADGLVCDDRQSCVMPETWGECNTDADCAGGCYCDEDLGGCLESGFCSSDADCTVDGQTCDEARGTCIPGEDPPPPPPPPACNTLTDEASCLDRTDCEPVYGGVDCTPACTTDPNSPDCTCESYYFAACADAAPST